MTQLRRPTKVMMLAVNATIDGKQAEVDRLVQENKLSKAELRQRVEYRDGRKYELQSSNNGVTRASRRGTASAPAVIPDITISRRTSVRQLFRLIEQTEQIRAQAQQELKRRPESEIEPVKKALGEIEILRRKREQLDAKIREAEEAFA